MPQPLSTERIWVVGQLVHAVAGALATRLNPVAVLGELSGFAEQPAPMASWTCVVLGAACNRLWTVCNPRDRMLCSSSFAPQIGSFGPAHDRPSAWVHGRQQRLSVWQHCLHSVQLLACQRHRIHLQIL